jgi:hypothetical protein
MRAAVPLLGVYPRELKAGTGTDTCTPIWHSSTVHHLAAKRWSQLKCLLMDEQINKNVIHTYNGVLFSLKKEGNSGTCHSIPSRLNLSITM